MYGSNRGHDSIAMFAVGGDGRLEPVGHEPTGGRTPRNFALDPSGALLLAANQNSDTIVTFRVDPATGLLRADRPRGRGPVPGVRGAGTRNLTEREAGFRTGGASGRERSAVAHFP